MYISEMLRLIDEITLERAIEILDEEFGLDDYEKDRFREYSEMNIYNSKGKEIASAWYHPEEEALYIWF